MERLLVWEVALGGGAAGYAGGFISTFIQTGNLGKAHSAGIEGAKSGVLMGGAIGTTTGAYGGYKYAKSHNLDPWTGKNLAPNKDVALNQFTESAIGQSVELIMSDPNKLNHIFDPKHNLSPLVKNLGGIENMLSTTLNNANGHLPSSGLFEIPVNVSGYNVTVRGNVSNGIIRVGTMYIP